MRRTSARTVCALIVPILLGGTRPEEASFLRPRPSFCEPFTSEALAAPLTASHRHKAAVAVCGLEAEYLRKVAFNVVGYQEDIRQQLRRLRLMGSHVAEGEVGSDHLVMGPNGLWLHSHWLSFPSGHGTLLQVQRDPSGQWMPLRLMIESAVRQISDIPPCFFALEEITKGTRRREAMLSAAITFVNQFQGFLERFSINDEAPIHAMGRAITPGAEGAWIMEPLEDWDALTGLRMDERTGWVFLRADKNPQHITAADEALLILQYWSSVLDRHATKRLSSLTLERSGIIDGQILPDLLRWVRSLAGCSIYSGLGSVRGITTEEVAYVVFLLQKAQRETRSPIQGQRAQETSLSVAS